MIAPALPSPLNLSYPVTLRAFEISHSSDRSVDKVIFTEGVHCFSVGDCDGDYQASVAKKWPVGLPAESPVSGSIRLNHAISAILIPAGATGETQLKTVRQLQVGTNVLVCGTGCSAQTVKVQCDDGTQYFVFSEDLLIAYLSAQAAVPKRDDQEVEELVQTAGTVS